MPLLSIPATQCPTRSDSRTPYLSTDSTMALLSDTLNWWLRMRRECRERFPRHRGLVMLTCITVRDGRAVMHAVIAN